MTQLTRESSAGRGFPVAAAPVCSGSDVRLPNLFIVPLLCALLVGVFGVPAAVGDGDRGPVRTHLQVTLWHTGYPGERELLSELVFSFQRANPDVVVALEWQDIEMADEWVRRWCGGYRAHAPDVTVMSELLAYRHRDELVELSGELRQRLRDDFEPSVVRRARGAPRGIPWSVGTHALYYRPDLLEEAGLSVPVSLEELVECARELADPPHRYGLGVPGPGGGGERLLHALALAHGPLRGRDEGEENDDRAEEDEDAADQEAEDEAGDPIARALGLLVKMQASGALQPEILTWSESELVELFAAGRLAMMIAPPTAARALRGAIGEADQRVEWSTAPMPVNEPGVGQVEVDWLVVFKSSDRREIAMRFLRYMAEHESQRALAMLPGVPATRTLADELAQTQPWAGHIPALDGAQGVSVSTWERLRHELGEAFAWAISGRLSPEAALEHARQ